MGRLGQRVTFVIAALAVIGAIRMLNRPAPPEVTLSGPAGRLMQVGQGEREHRPSGEDVYTRLAKDVTLSLDCRFANDAIDLAVCNSAELMQKERVLHATYWRTLGRMLPYQRILLRDEQRLWRERRNTCEPDAGNRIGCLVHAYDARISELSSR